MYHINGATMSLACVCMGMGATLDNNAQLPLTHMLSLSLAGIMIAPSAIARLVNMWRRK